jgi:hypothetical protein
MGGVSNGGKGVIEAAQMGRLGRGDFVWGGDR